MSALGTVAGARQRLRSAYTHARYRLPGRFGLDSAPWMKVSARDAGRSFDLAVATIFKDEVPDLVEWIEFHRLVGIQKFLLYDNNSTDDPGRVLQPYVDEGLVTVHPFPPWPGQLLCYNSCLQAYRDRARWIAFIDVDEFLYPAAGDSLPAVLADYEEHPALAVNWLMFSTSGHVVRPQGLVIENYTRCQIEGNRHVKLIVNPKRVEGFHTSHDAVYVEGACAVNELHQPVTGPHSVPPSMQRIRLNHYWTKSVEDFLVRRAARGEVRNVPTGRDLEGLLDAERRYSTGTDRTILRFVPRLREAVAHAGAGGPEEVGAYTEQGA